MHIIYRYNILFKDLANLDWLNEEFEKEPVDKDYIYLK